MQKISKQNINSTIIEMHRKNEITIRLNLLQQRMFGKKITERTVIRSSQHKDKAFDKILQILMREKKRKFLETRNRRNIFNLNIKGIY